MMNFKPTQTYICYKDPDQSLPTDLIDFHNTLLTKAIAQWGCNPYEVFMLSLRCPAALQFRINDLPDLSSGLLVGAEDPWVAVAYHRVYENHHLVSSTARQAQLVKYLAKLHKVENSPNGFAVYRRSAVNPYCYEWLDIGTLVTEFAEVNATLAPRGTRRAPIP
jgi:hypothetical protein